LSLVVELSVCILPFNSHFLLSLLILPFFHISVLFILSFTYFSWNGTYGYLHSLWGEGGEKYQICS
jgi:hypothetical protein